MVGKAGLIVVVGFSIILGFMSLNMARLGNKAVNNMSSYNDATLSHNLATAGANIVLSRFYADTTWRGDTTQTLSGQNFNGSIRYGVANTGTPNLVRMQAISTYRSPMLPISETLHDTVMVYLNTNASSTFSKYAWLTNNENSVNWTTADTVWGLVHSNGTLYVSGKPVFMQKITTSKSFSPAPGKTSGGKTNNAIFKNGYETSVPIREFPNNLARMDSAATAGGKKYNGATYPNRWVTLNPGTADNGDGFVVVRNSSFTTGALNDTIRPSNPAFNGVMSSTGVIHVKGKLDGVLSIAATSTTSDVFIEDTIRYEKNPLTTTSDDLLGIVADRDVVVADNVANNTNCSIDGCIFTRTGSFKAQNHDNTSPVHAQPLYGELRILGSIVQNNRGAVGTVSGGGTLATGFSKRYRFDDRLTETFKPPLFPEYLTKVYCITNWWESMRVPNLRE
ncbi:MAG TPA: hypothetical protein DGH68_09090 [Bacteroidetes bacterium]|nr:hypothetical protein [Bacteroidota bacterium]